MEELLSYRLADFLLFSEQTYLRQFARYNHSIFPAQLFSSLFGLYFLYSIINKKQSQTQLLFRIYSLFWLWTGYGFLWKYYAEINTYAVYFAFLFAAQGILLLLRSLSAVSIVRFSPQRYQFNSGLILWLLALLVLPIEEILLGRSLSQVSSFALTPDSIAIASMAFFFMLNINAWWLLPAAIWLLISFLTYLAMESLAALLPGIGLIFYVLAISKIGFK